MASKPSPDPTITQLVASLRGGHAHATFEDAVEGFPVQLRGTVPNGLPYSAWQLVEHLRIAQQDILEFSAPPATGYKPRRWPEDYWPRSPTPPTPQSWDQSIAAIHADRDSFIALLTKPDAGLHNPLPSGDGQTLMREALLIIDHNSYHTGELVLLRRLLGAWKH